MILSCVGFQSDRRSDSILIEFKNTKLGHKGALPGSCEYFSNFGTPHISAMAEDTNLKFCMRIDGKGC